MRIMDFFFKPRNPRPEGLFENDLCPKCNTTDCISLTEYRKHLKISGAGVMSVPAKIVNKTCNTRQQRIAATRMMNRLKQDI